MKELLGKIKAVIEPTIPLMSNLSNVSALLNELPNINCVAFI